jgi:signal transduction histidine kinase
MHLSDLFRTTGVKLALACAAFFLFATLTTTSVAVYQISDDLDKWLDQSLTETSTYLVNEFKGGGVKALAASVEQHASASEGDNDLFVLVDQTGKKIAGNVKEFKVQYGWHDAQPQEFGLKGRRQFRVLGQAVGNMTLIIARNDAAVYEIGDIIENAFIVSSVVMALSMLLAGILLGMRAQKRVETFTQTLDAVALGDINRRIDVVPVGGDDIDQIARKLNLTLDHLSSAMLSMQQVTVDIAHDLKSPIARLRNRLTDSIANLEAGHDAKKDLQEAIAESDHVTHTFDAMLRIAQIESGERRQRFEDLDLASVVHRTADIYAAVIEDAGGRLSVNLPADRPWRIFGDGQLILQLLANLIENSLNHGSGAPHIRISVEDNAGGVSLLVADNGPGIPEAERGKVQERFYRVDKSRSSKGSGLGLSLVTAIVNLHGGKMKLADNNPGLVVQIDFPVSQALGPYPNQSSTAH